MQYGTAIAGGGLKVYWSQVRHRPEAWAHVRTVIAGAADTAECKVCGRTAPLEVPGVTRQSVLRLFTRIHFYRHKVGDSLNA